MPPSTPRASGDEALSSSAPLTAAAPSPHPFATPEAARYLPVDHLGRGGMGRVTAVFDRRLNREVARKDVPPEAPDASALERRLEREARVTARLDHPGIVAVHDAGTDPAGHPYFTMRFIRGRSFAAALDAQDLGPTTLLRHFLSVGDAVAHAHARGVVHRDLKPDNLMLGPHGETQVVDWGVARVLDDADLDPALASPEREGQTVAGARVGTSAWMSPEQARGEPVGPSSDVFSLGLILDRIVARLPNRDLELDAIVGRATAEDPSARYPDAGALSLDLAAYLDGRRVSAFNYSALDLARRFYRAFRAPILVAAVGLLVVLVVLVVAYTETRRERDLAELAEARAEAALSSSEESYATLLTERAIDAWRQGARAEAALLAAASLERRESPDARAVLALHAPSAALEAAYLPPSCITRRLSPDPDVRALACLGVDTLSLWALEDEPTLLWEVPSRWDELGWLGPDQLIVSGRDGIHLIDVASSAVFASPHGFVAGRALSNKDRALVDTAEGLFSVDLETTAASLILEAPRRLPWALSGDGKIALSYDEASSRPQRIDLTTGSFGPLDLAFEHDAPMSAALDHAGTRAAFGTPRGRIVLVELDSRKSRTLELTVRPLTHVAFSPDGQWLVARDERGFVTLVSAGADAPFGHVIALPRIPVESVTWRGTELVTLGAELLTWRMPAEPEALVYRTNAGIAALALSRENLALADGSGALSVFALNGGHRVHRLEAPAEGVAKDLTFVPDISTIKTMAEPRLAAIWPGRYEAATWRPPAPAVRLASAVNYRRLVALSDGTLLAATYGSGLHHFATRDAPPSNIPLGASPIDLVTSHDAQSWAALTSNGEVHLGRVESGISANTTLAVAPDAVAVALAAGPTATLAYITPHVAVCFDPDGASATRRTFAPPAPEARLAAVALSRDGAMLAVGTLEGRVLVWQNDAKAHLLIDGRAHGQRVSDLVFSASGVLFSASWDGSALRWHPAVEPPTRQTLERLHGFGLGHATRADLR